MDVAKQTQQYKQTSTTQGAWARLSLSMHLVQLPKLDPKPLTLPHEHRSMQADYIFSRPIKYLRTGLFHQLRGRALPLYRSICSSVETIDTQQTADESGSVLCLIVTIIRGSLHHYTFRFQRHKWEDYDCNAPYPLIALCKPINRYKYAVPSTHNTYEDGTSKKLRNGEQHHPPQQPRTCNRALAEGALFLKTPLDD